MQRPLDLPHHCWIVGRPMALTWKHSWMPGWSQQLCPWRLLVILLGTKKNTEVPCFNEQKCDVDIGFVHFSPEEGEAQVLVLPTFFFIFIFSPARSIGQTGQEQADGAFKAGKVSGWGWGLGCHLKIQAAWCRNAHGFAKPEWHYSTNFSSKVLRGSHKYPNCSLFVNIKPVP